MSDGPDGSGGGYELISRDSIYSGAVISLNRDKVRMSDGSVATREVVEHPGAVGVVAVDDEGQVVLINQYRHPVGRRLDELPAGLLDVDGEPPLQTAQRELAEEAQLKAGDWRVLVDLNPTPGMSNEAIRIYLARKLEPADDEFTPEHEELELTVRRESLSAAVERCLRGEITNAAAVAGLLAAASAAANDFESLRPADAPWYR
ncbi:MAG TPA: NUDIX hydrolase [Jatrophihabitantaceae bacterium]|nr:NUDIX hydrolase [Jatrophihabitantaceae bacterium]